MNTYPRINDEQLSSFCEESSLDEFPLSVVDDDEHQASSSKGDGPNNNSEMTNNKFSSYFAHGIELDRNQIIDETTKRSYVYTNDLSRNEQLPEILFLDVPESQIVAQTCGRFIVDEFKVKLLNSLIIDCCGSRGGGTTRAAPTTMMTTTTISSVKTNPKKKKLVAKAAKKRIDSIKKIVDNRVYEVKNMIHHIVFPSPNEKVNHSLKFRLRYAQYGSKLHKMLCSNFMNDKCLCPHGIIVFIPCMKKEGKTNQCWGSLEGVEKLPEHTPFVDSQKIDAWCLEVAKRHGRYRGKSSPPNLALLTTADATDTSSASGNIGMSCIYANSSEVSVTVGSPRKNDGQDTGKKSPSMMMPVTMNMTKKQKRPSESNRDNKSKKIKNSVQKYKKTAIAVTPFTLSSKGSSTSVVSNIAIANGTAGSIPKKMFSNDEQSNNSKKMHPALVGKTAMKIRARHSTVSGTIPSTAPSTLPTTTSIADDKAVAISFETR